MSVRKGVSATTPMDTNSLKIKKVKAVAAGIPAAVGDGEQWQEGGLAGAAFGLGYRSGHLWRGGQLCAARLFPALASKQQPAPGGICAAGPHGWRAPRPATHSEQSRFGSGLCPDSGARGGG